ncbi:MAG TPA: hypothetical protein PLZ43_11885 [bacterium]|nr:hypothetical protein [bacterium]
MSATVIGKVKAGSGKTFEVKWDQGDKNIYVAWAGWTKIGQAGSASEAMVKAEAWLYNK